MEPLTPPEKPLERSVSSAGIAVPKRREIDDVGKSTTSTRPRANTGSRTPRMFGLGVPAEKVATGRSLRQKSSTSCLLSPPENQVPLLANSLPDSGVATPAIVLTPSPNDNNSSSDGIERGLLSLASSLASDNSNLSALREDILSPPLGAVSPASPSYPGSSNSGGGFPAALLAQSIGRSRRNTTSTTEKSVNFEEPPSVTAEVVFPGHPIPENGPLYIKTVQFDDPDPTFHRSINSPSAPAGEAYVEQVGAFRVANLRNDSLGNLPKIFSTDSEEGTPTTEEIPDQGGDGDGGKGGDEGEGGDRGEGGDEGGDGSKDGDRGGGGDGAEGNSGDGDDEQDEGEEEESGSGPDGPAAGSSAWQNGSQPVGTETAAAPPQRPKRITLRRPSVEGAFIRVPDPTASVNTSPVPAIGHGEAVTKHSPEQDPLAAFPPIARTRSAPRGYRKPIPPGVRNPSGVLPAGATGTTAVCNAAVVQREAIISSPYEQSMSTLASMRNPFGGSSAFNPTGGELSAVDGRWVRRRGSVAASIRSIHEILWKDDSLKPTPEPTPPASRRSSAWALGKGSLGLRMDPWGAGVQSSQ